MHYQAIVYNKNGVASSRFIANSVDVLKSKAMPYINNERITRIEVSRVEDIGYFKLPKELEKYLKDEML